MPPVPDPLYDETIAKLERLSRRLNDAQSFQIPRLRAHTGTVVVQQQYAAELREDLDACRRELQILETFEDDIRNAERRKEVNDQLDTLIPKVDELKKEFRSALLESKRNIDAQTPSLRDELLRSSAAQAPKAQRGSNAEDAVMHASEAVTDALRQTTQLMQAELERSVLSTQLLEESTQTMHTTSLAYDTFSSLLSTSRSLIVSLEKADWLDRMLVLSSLAFFLLVVGYIVKKRVIDKGIWLAFWWVKYLPVGGRTVPEVYDLNRGIVDGTVGAVTTMTASSLAAASLSSSVASVAASRREELVSSASSSSSSSSVPSEISQSPANTASTPTPTPTSILDSILPSPSTIPESTLSLDIDEAVLDELEGFRHMKEEEEASRSPRDDTDTPHRVAPGTLPRSVMRDVGEESDPAHVRDEL